MCAFDEFADKEPASTQQALREAQSARRNARDHRSSYKVMQGDVWLGTDEDLFPMLAAREPELSQSPSPTRECTFPLHERPTDSGFLVHLASISSRKVLVQSPVEEQQPPAGKSSIVILSPGKKRVLASPPNNNPFKRGKGSDEAFETSSKARLFDTKLDGDLSCREDQCLEDAIWVQVQSSQDACRSSDVRHEAHGSIVRGDATDVKTAGRRSLLTNFQASVSSKLGIPAPAALFVQHVESQRGISSRSNRALVVTTAQETGVIQVSVKPDLKVSSSVEVDTFCTEPVRLQYVPSIEAVEHQEPPLMSPARQDWFEQQFLLEACADSMSLNMLLPIRAVSDDTKTPTFTNGMQREAKAKKQIRSSYKQSRKGVMAASMPSLLKFFQRAPTSCHPSCT